jgi:hypothetical protein
VLGCGCDGGHPPGVAFFSSPTFLKNIGVSFFMQDTEVGLIYETVNTAAFWCKSKAVEARQVLL